MKAHLQAGPCRLVPTPPEKRLLISKTCVATILLAATTCHAADRINHAGRILGDVPTVTNSLLFNTPEADAVVSTLQIMPTDNPWNEDISGRPVLSNSAAMINQIYSDLQSARKNLRVFQEMNYALVPDNQPLVPVAFVDYPDESDPSPYPFPSNLPVEMWPSGTDGQTLYEWQIDVNNWGSDRHSIAFRVGTGDFWETWQTKLVGTNWQASNGAKFNIFTNSLRPGGWTSADAAGLPMFPALVRWGECERGEIEHALRVVFPKTRRAYIYPATHFASTNTNPNEPAMGQRIRLKANYPIPDGWTKQEKAICRAFKKYGGLVADNGGFFSISSTPDDRYPSGCFDNLQTYLCITNFEVIASTSTNEGPRSPGKPVVNAGNDMTVPMRTSVSLAGSVTVTGGQFTVLWSLYSGPGTATFTNAAITNTLVNFSIPGTYTLMIKVSDGVHTPQYDTVDVLVRSALKLGISPAGSGVEINWAGADPPYVLETAADLVAPTWSVVQSNSSTSAVLSSTNPAGFFRVKGR